MILRDSSELVYKQVIDVMTTGNWVPQGISCQKLGVNVFQVGKYTLTVDKLIRSAFSTTTWAGTYNFGKNTFQMVYNPINRDANHMVTIHTDSGDSLIVSKPAY